LRLLLDTHTLLWASLGDPRLSLTARRLLGRPEHSLYVSAVTPWEIATKYRKGKLPEASRLLEGFHGLVQAAGYRLLPVSCDHGLRAGSFAHAHPDPFDRILVAQALVENLIMLSADEALDAFSIQRIW
jgi:PIN domain nuclease of toxin-antitoxin system